MMQCVYIISLYRYNNANELILKVVEKTLWTWHSTEPVFISVNYDS